MAGLVVTGEPLRRGLLRAEGHQSVAQCTGELRSALQAEATATCLAKDDEVGRKDGAVAAIGLLWLGGVHVVRGPH